MKRALLVLLLIAAAPLAMAITPANVQRPLRSSAAEPPAKMAPAKTTEGTKETDDSSGMRRGVVQKVDLANGVFQVFGQPVSFDAKRVRVIGADGKQTTIYALKQGANVRFTLDPTDPKQKRAAVIYVN
jgi:hypothetical protein